MTDIVGRNLGEGSAGIPAGLGGSPEVVVNECEGKVISLNIKSIVKYEKDFFPATGTLALEEEIPGWLYNKAMTQNLKEKENYLNDYLLNVHQSMIEHDFYRFHASKPYHEGSQCLHENIHGCSLEKMHFFYNFFFKG